MNNIAWSWSGSEPELVPIQAEKSSRAVCELTLGGVKFVSLLAGDSVQGASAAVCKKMNGYTLRGSNSVFFIIASHINWGHLIKERICSHRSKFFHLRVDHFRTSGKQTGSQKENCLPLKTWRKKIKVYPYTLIMLMYLFSYKTEKIPSKTAQNKQISLLSYLSLFLLYINIKIGKNRC